MLRPLAAACLAAAAATAAAESARVAQCVPPGHALYTVCAPYVDTSKGTMVGLAGNWGDHPAATPELAARAAATAAEQNVRLAVGAAKSIGATAQCVNALEAMLCKAMASECDQRGSRISITPQGSRGECKGVLEYCYQTAEIPATAAMSFALFGGQEIVSRTIDGWCAPIEAAAQASTFTVDAGALEVPCVDPRGLSGFDSDCAAHLSGTTTPSMGSAVKMGKSCGDLGYDVTLTWEINPEGTEMSLMYRTTGQQQLYGWQLEIGGASVKGASGGASGEASMVFSTNEHSVVAISLSGQTVPPSPGAATLLAAVKIELEGPPEGVVVVAPIFAGASERPIQVGIDRGNGCERPPASWPEPGHGHGAPLEPADDLILGPSATVSMVRGVMDTITDVLAAYGGAYGACRDASSRMISLACDLEYPRCLPGGAGVAFGTQSLQSCEEIFGDGQGSIKACIADVPVTDAAGFTTMHALSVTLKELYSLLCDSFAPTVVPPPPPGGGGHGTSHWGTFFVVVLVLAAAAALAGGAYWAYKNDRLPAWATTNPFRRGARADDYQDDLLGDEPY